MIFWQQLICFLKILELPVIFINTQINLWRVFIFITSLLAFISNILTGYLIGYHIYLSEDLIFNLFNLFCNSVRLILLNFT